MAACNPCNRRGAEERPAYRFLFQYIKAALRQIENVLAPVGRRVLDANNASSAEARGPKQNLPWRVLVPGRGHRFFVGIPHWLAPPFVVGQRSVKSDAALEYTLTGQHLKRQNYQNMAYGGKLTNRCRVLVALT